MATTEFDKLFPYDIPYRGYVFVNTALSSIQKGVQGTHAVAELFNIYNDFNTSLNDILFDWVRHHRTLIFLDGGFHANLMDNYKTFGELCSRLRLPSVKFHEDEDTLNGAMTAFAGIIPSTVYDIPEETIAEFKEAGNFSKLLKHTKAWDERDAALEAQVQLCLFLRQFNLAT